MPKFIEVEDDAGTRQLVNVAQIVKIVVVRPEGAEAAVNIALPGTKITVKGAPATRLIQAFRQDISPQDRFVEVEHA